ncbi:hypothetical protein PFLUV_G00238990 [Perca fluviatilis]|uniref:CBM21 domain-containing protein n=1 Tax=Perca fluviatilis TaxID=8168 RepID=A0A6A5DPP7_PERFL|nr:hypothetical protein PFLUV_G00238990 [Perca fluviatilis]
MARTCSGFSSLKWLKNKPKIIRIKKRKAAESFPASRCGLCYIHRILAGNFWMNCSRRSVEVLAPRPMMPVDVAVRICLASSPPLRSFLGNYDNGFSPAAATLLKRCELLRPCLSSSGNPGAKATASCTPPMPVECSGGTAWLEKKKKKKSVVFADARGLALAAVHVFDEAEDEALAELQFTLTEIEGATVSRLHHGDREDAAACGPGLCFWTSGMEHGGIRLPRKGQTPLGSLETLSTSVCSPDISCRYLNTAYGGPDVETFAFSVPVPEVLGPSDRVEFCIQYQTQDQTFWDNNQGKNYRLADPNAGQPRTAESPSGLQIQRDHGGEKREQIIECDPFGSPRTSAGIFPEWQSWGRVETSAPYW